MLERGSAFEGLTIEARDGRIGSVRDALFDDHSWLLRWLVVDTGGWLSGRKVLLQPASVVEADFKRGVLHVQLSRAEVQASPGVAADEPVSRQMDQDLRAYYGAGAGGGNGRFGAESIALPLQSPPFFGIPAVQAVAAGELGGAAGDPNLRSAAEVTGYRVQARDGEIGHVGDLLVDSANWRVTWLIVETRNWFPGQHVLVSPQAVRLIEWADHHIEIDITRAQVQASPPWSASNLADPGYEARLRRHYGWSRYQW